MDATCFSTMERLRLIGVHFDCVSLFWSELLERKPVDYLSPKYLNKTLPDLVRVSNDGLVIFTAQKAINPIGLEKAVEGKEKEQENNKVKEEKVEVEEKGVLELYKKSDNGVNEGKATEGEKKGMLELYKKNGNSVNEGKATEAAQKARATAVLSEKGGLVVKNFIAILDPVTGETAGACFVVIKISVEKVLTTEEALITEEKEEGMEEEDGDFCGRENDSAGGRQNKLTRVESCLKLRSVYFATNVEGLPPDRIVPTVGLNIGWIEVANRKLVFWDLGGQLGLRSIWKKYYEEEHAVVFAVDASCPSRFEDSKSSLG
ncbi:unnamed protein product [Vicia faba]|uniref:Uncharacterized protein n=1 Tax=Vicia faba TaxID=3906 RepID=A0AAV1B2P3_VICFA|nr:unnamed protein product [Vicia faba]